MVNSTQFDAKASFLSLFIPKFLPWWPNRIKTTTGSGGTKGLSLP
jgi:hypothetical protein